MLWSRLLVVNQSLTIRALLSQAIAGQLMRLEAIDRQMGAVTQAIADRIKPLMIVDLKIVGAISK